MRKLTTAFLSVLALSQSLSAVDNRELKIGMTQEFENPNPIVMQMRATTYIYSFVGRTLNTLDPDGKTVPLLAVETPTVENGLAEFFEEDGKRKLRAHWEIREDADWGDGTPVTGHDFKLGWEIGMTDTVAVGDREMYEQIERIEVHADNPKKFDIVFGAPKFDYFKMYQLYFIPAHLEEAIFDAHKGENQGYEKNTKFVTDPTHPGLYCGPYRVSEMKLGSHVILVPNEKWQGHKPSIEKVILKFIPNTATLEANLRSGTLDMISTLGLTFDQAIAFEKRVAEDQLPYRVNFNPSLAYEHIDLQIAKNETLKSINVRKALVHSVDRDLLCETLFAGKQQKAIHNFAPIDPWYTDDPEKIVLYRYSRRTANKLLDEEGWTMGDDGYRYKDGQKLSLQIMTTAQDKTRENVEVFLQSEWKKVGIELTIKNEAARVFFGETVRKGNYPDMAMFAWISLPEMSPRTSHSEAIPNESNGFAGQNSGGWSKEEVDTVIESLEVEFNFEKRRDLAHKFLYYYTDEVPVIPLYYRSDVTVTPVNLQGYRMTGSLVSASTWGEYWHLQN